MPKIPAKADDAKAPMPRIKAMLLLRLSQIQLTTTARTANHNTR